MLSRLKNILRAAAGHSTYEATNFSRRRSDVPGPRPQDSRLELTQYARGELVRKSRYLSKNSGFWKEIGDCFKLYGVGPGLGAQSLAVDKDWRNEAERQWRIFCARPEITNRFTMSESQLISSACLTEDGEFFAIKTRDQFDRPKVQFIESHRLVDGGKNDSVDGIVYDNLGRVVLYRFLQDDGTIKEVRAGAVMHVHAVSRFTSARYAPPMQHSILDLLDFREILALEKHAVKQSADIIHKYKTKTGGLQDNGDFSLDGATQMQSKDAAYYQAIIGGKVIGMDPNEDLESFESKRPNNAFTGFLEAIMRDASGGVLPYEFSTDPTKAGGAVVRLIVAKAQRTFEAHQRVLIERLLNPLWGYVMAKLINLGDLEPVKGWNLVEWTTPKSISVDAGRDEQQTRNNLETGLITWADYWAEQGKDEDSQIRKRTEGARKIMAAAGYKESDPIPLWMIYRPTNAPIQPLENDETTKNP